MTPNQSSLLRKAKRSLDAARHLLKNGDEDFAASRAYYAMFYAAQAILLKKNLTFKSHAAVISAFGQHFAATGEIDKTLHQHLIAAQYARNAGDYMIDVELNAEDVEEHIANAELFIETIEAALQREAD